MPYCSVMASSQNDSAISAVTTSMIPASTKPLSTTVSQGERSRSKSNSPRTAQSPGYAALSASEQAAEDLENVAAVAQAQASIVPDSGSDGLSMSDAGYESDSMGSASVSLTSSVRHYRFENGRRYHRFREGTYNFPNDESEQERELMKHVMMVNLCQTLHFAPLGENPGEILDLGTGIGAWAVESESYPRSSPREGSGRR